MVKSSPTSSNCSNKAVGYGAEDPKTGSVEDLALLLHRLWEEEGNIGGENRE